MSALTTETLLGVFLVFCRFGAAFLFAPGLSSNRIPVQFRLFLAIGLSLALSPLLLDRVVREITDGAQDPVFMIVAETTVGALIGLMARTFLMALQFAATAASNLIGLAGIPGIPLDQGEEAASPLTTLVSSAAAMIILALGLHLEMIGALIDSYQVFGIGEGVPAARGLDSLVSVVAQTSLLSLQLAAPFIAYGLMINVMIGIANRFAAQVSLYYATTGGVMLGGFLLLYLVWPQWIMTFISSYRAWLTKGGF
jgi:flagellar biosynthetic protein FliR